MSGKLRYVAAVPFVVLLLGAAALMGATPCPELAMAQGSTLYVDDDTCPALGSGTPVDPYCAIQSAVNAASSQDEIRVAQGRYTGAEMVAFAPHDWTHLYTYTQVVFIYKPITLSGGFSPTDWDTPDPTANPTVIDTEGCGRGVPSSPPAPTRSPSTASPSPVVITPTSGIPLKR